MPKLPEKYEDWTAPWEKEDGEFDVEKAKKLTWDLLKDQEKNRAKIAQDKAAIEALADERDSYKDKAEAKAGDETAKDAEIAELKKAVRERDKRLEKVADYDDVVAERDRYDTALTKNLTKSQALRLVGKTREELLEDADVLRADLGLDNDPDEGDGSPDDDSRDDGRGDGDGPRRGSDGRFEVNGIVFTPRHHTGSEGGRGGAGRVDPGSLDLSTFG